MQPVGPLVHPAFHMMLELKPWGEQITTLFDKYGIDESLLPEKTRRDFAWAGFGNTPVLPAPVDCPACKGQHMRVAMLARCIAGRGDFAKTLETDQVYVHPDDFKATSFYMNSRPIRVPQAKLHEDDLPSLIERARAERVHVEMRQNRNGRALLILGQEKLA